ncbi:hypothetical protein GDO81_015887 [Engystomops pustulosus]|uniref:AFG3-like protein 1 n=1 Tax=Engystomops pustulosus TaxID=76066 RepID=A0AAV7AN51_ENGPU|nr:hypothetical protein GDO81_015887 [Engystomops pustulosus]
MSPGLGRLFFSGAGRFYRAGWWRGLSCGAGARQSLRGSLVLHQNLRWKPSPVLSFMSSKPLRDQEKEPGSQGSGWNPKKNNGNRKEPTWWQRIQKSEFPWDDKDFRSLLFLAAGLITGFGIFYLRDSGKEISWKEFVHLYLERGRVCDVVYCNCNTWVFIVFLNDPSFRLFVEIVVPETSFPQKAQEF